MSLFVHNQFLLGRDILINEDLSTFYRFLDAFIYLMINCICQVEIIA